MSALLGIDIGTSATKAVVCNDNGAVLGTASSPHQLSQPRPGWSEQDPRHWWSATKDAVAKVLSATGVGATQIRGVGLSGQMHGSVFLSRRAVENADAEPEPLRPALLWNDQRTAAQCAQIEEALGGRRRMVGLVGNAALTGFTLPKILWLRDEEPEIFAQVARVILPKDYVALCLTGEIATDVGDGAGTLLMDVDRRRWSQEAIQAVGLSSDLLPPVLESAQVVGHVTGRAAGETGLAEGTPVVAGSGDNMTGGVGAGVVEPGMVLATLGTSGVIFAHADRPHKDLGPTDDESGRVHTMCAATGTEGRTGGWTITGCMLSAAGSLQWCRDALFPGASFNELVEEAGQSPPGSRGLVFLPHLTGERCPYADPLARGGWIGLTSRHTRGDLVRAVIEGVTFGMGQILSLVRGIGVAVETVRLGGGGARSQLWRQMQADVYGCPVVTTNAEEGPAYGAALLAGVGAGVWANIAEACRAGIRETEVRDPDPVQAERYAPAQVVYQRMYPRLKEHMAALSRADV